MSLLNKALMRLLCLVMLNGLTTKSQVKADILWSYNFAHPSNMAYK